MSKEVSSSAKCEICGRVVEKAALKEHILKVHKMAEGESLISQKALQRRKSLKSMALYILGVLVVAIIAAYFFLPWRSPVLSYGAEVGQKAPLFRLPDLSGSYHSLGDFLGKKPIMVEFLWTKCPHCQSIAPLLNQVYEKWSQKVEFISLAGDPRDNRSLVSEFAATHGNKWPHLMGTMDVMKNYGIEGYPSFFFVDKDGVIKGKIVGAPPIDMLEQELKKLTS